jgi:hypothetical protein
MPKVVEPRPLIAEPHLLRLGANPPRRIGHQGGQPLLEAGPVPVPPELQLAQWARDGGVDPAPEPRVHRDHRLRFLRLGARHLNLEESRAEVEIRSRARHSFSRKPVMARA